ncbi:hypothetical protein F3K43_27365 [Streptomyces sp. LBUM 1476]|nr:hypothetical protein [Streptomyces sp. LBUM 1476]
MEDEPPVVVVEPPVDDEPPVEEEPPVVDEPPVVVEPPVVEGSPVVDEPPVEDEPPLEDVPPIEIRPPAVVVVEPPVVEGSPVVEPLVEDEPPVVVEPPVVEGSPVVDEPPVDDGSPVVEPPVVEGSPVVEPPDVDEPPVDEVPPVVGSGQITIVQSSPGGGGSFGSAEAIPATVRDAPAAMIEPAAIRAIRTRVFLVIWLLPPVAVRQGGQRRRSGDRRGTESIHVPRFTYASQTTRASLHPPDFSQHRQGRCARNVHLRTLCRVKESVSVT